ncbi:hypothetical protein HDU76_008907, partial [Blyttiomyces sp. JEL0837]
VFGGINNNEGMGLFSLCFDWQYITSSCLSFPWTTQINLFIGTAGCIMLMPLMYYNNVWNAQNFPFMAQNLFLLNGTSYDQTVILDDDNNLDIDKYNEYGQPYFAATWAMQLMSNNLGITAAITHTILWYGQEIWEALKVLWTPGAATDDKHYKAMLKYKEVPQWWFLAILVGSFAVAMALIYVNKSQLTWWAFIICVLIAAILVLLVGFMGATTGFTMPTQPLVQLLGGFVQPGKPVANMYFTLFGYNTTLQALGLLGDLKLGQYLKIAPRAVFGAQILGTVIGGILNYAITISIVDNQREILLDINGNLQWSGQNAQNYNSQAISWGALGKQMFGPGATYEWVSYSFLLGFVLPIPFWLAHRFFPKFGFNYINTAIISWYLGYLTVGINSSIFSYILIGMFSQYYLRRYHAAWFNKYNYLLSAALDAGTQVAAFLMTLFLFGAASIPTQNMPYYFLNPNTTGTDGYQDFYQDYCGQKIPVPSE